MGTATKILIIALHIGVLALLYWLEENKTQQPEKGFSLPKKADEPYTFGNYKSEPIQQPDKFQLSDQVPVFQPKELKHP